MPVWRTTGRPAFRDMPDVAGSERRLSSLCAQRAVSLLRCDGRVPKEWRLEGLGRASRLTIP
jgi:hypothetical protein